MTASSRIIFLALAFLNALAPAAFAADATLQREQDWNRAVRAAEQEGEIVLSALSEVGEVFTHGGFQKKFPKIKLNVVPARGGDQVTRIMAERRAGKFLVDVGNMGNTSPYRLYQARVLDPIASAFLIPEVEDESKWWQGKHQFIDPEGKYMSARRFI